MSSLPNKAPAPADDRIKFLVIIKDCDEARAAAFFAGRRAKVSGARVVLMMVISPPEFSHWASVTETMRAEAHEEAAALLKTVADDVETELGEAPECLIAEGDIIDEIRKRTCDDPDIAFIFLGAAEDGNGPGPLVSAVSKDPTFLSPRPVPLVIVPGSASRDELRRLSG